jgi:hypothetical protein
MNEAESRLEEKLQSENEDGTSAKLDAVTKERDALLARLNGFEPLLDAYSDMLAAARNFKSKAEICGIKPRHARSVKGGGKKQMR